MSRCSSAVRVLAWVAFAGVPACGEGTAPRVPTYLAVTDTVPMVSGGTAQLAVTVLAADSTPMVGVSLSFQTLDPAIVTVSPTGLVTSVGPGGSTVVRISVDAVTADVTVLVFTHPAGTIQATTPVTARPFGIAIGRGGHVYVTRLDPGAISWSVLPQTDLSGTITVGSEPTSVAFAPSGTRAFVANQFSSAVGVISVLAAQQTALVPLAGNPFYVLASKDGANVYATLNSNFLSVIDANLGSEVARLPVGDAPNGLALHPTEPRLFVTAFFGGTITEVNTDTRQVTRTLAPGGTLQGIVAAPEGDVLYVADEGGDLKVVDIATGGVTQVPGASGGFGLALSPDGRQLYMGVPSTGIVRVIDRASRTVVGTITTGGVPRRIAFDYFGGWAAIANESGWVTFVR
ncbi:MAG: YncE family protein [Gemmatimonadota bacterium]|nr:YncE family protein [Gemmatimonadota bacterium]